MAVFKSLHFGESIKALRGVIRYNSIEKKGFNSEINPRLIGVHSNIGVCENVNDQSDYNNLMSDFILCVRANSNLSNNKRQKYLYEHSIISFDVADDEKLGMEKLTELALKIANEVNPDDAPMMLWPQTDNDHGLHFHLVRGMHNENGVYQKKKNDFININKFIQKLEVDENLTLTGKNNPDNYVWKTVNGKKKKTYIPQGNNDGSKIAKNKNVDTKIKINEEGRIKYIEKINGKIIDTEELREKKESKKKRVKTNAANKVAEINQENTELNKPVKYNILQKGVNFVEKTFLVNDATRKYKDRKLLDEKVENNNNKIELVKKKESKKTEILDTDLNTIENHLTKLDKIVDEKNNDIDEEKQDLAEKIAKDKEFSDFKDLINKAYRSSENAEIFLKTLNDNNVEVAISYRENGQGGISFNQLDNDISLAGGKVNSYLTFGKIKKNDPDLFALLTGATGFGEITLTNKNDVNNSINIETINKNYKQKINNDGSTSIFYNKKDSDKYPHNHNLKLNADKNKISFGQFSNNHDIKLAYDLAKKENWTNAKSDNKELIKKSMVIAFAENKEDLFFFQTKEPSLTMFELKEIIGDETLSTDNLIKLYDDVIIKDEKDESLVFIKNQLKANDVDITKVNNLLKTDLSLKEIITEINKPEVKAVDEKEKITIEIKETSKPEIKQTSKSKSKYKYDKDGNLVKREE